MTDLILPSWPAPPHIHAFNTTRCHGESLSPYATNNLAHHVNDDPHHVNANRHHLLTEYGLPQAPHWLTQTHSTDCICIEETANRQADAAITRLPNQPLAILTADCLPILLCDQAGREVAAIHAGWRGLANGMIEATLSKMTTHPTQLMAWLGPRICAHCFEVEEDVFTLFKQRYPLAATTFVSHKPGKCLVDLAQISTHILSSHGLTSIYDSKLCTLENKNLFFSYRRDGQTGRMASIIWISESSL